MFEHGIAIRHASDIVGNRARRLVAGPCLEFRRHETRRREERAEKIAHDALLHAWTMQHTSEHVMHLLQNAGVAAGVVQNAADLLEHDPQLRHRGHYHLLQHPVTGPTLYMGSPFLLSATPAALRPASVRQGVDTLQRPGCNRGCSTQMQREAPYGAGE